MSRDPTDDFVFATPAPPDALQYYSTSHGRPGILTAIAIIVCVFGAMASFLQLTITHRINISLRIFSRMNNPPAALATPQSTAIASPHASTPDYSIHDYDSNTGLPAAQRKIVLGRLMHSHPVTDNRRKEINALLAECGRQIFISDPDQITAQRVDISIMEATTNPSQSSSTPDDLFTLSSGQLRVSDTSVSFFPMGESIPLTIENGSFTSSAGSRLSLGVINALCSRIQQLAPQKLTPQSIYALHEALKDPTLNLIHPAPAELATQQIKSVRQTNDGSITIESDSSTITLTAYNTLIYANGTRFIAPAPMPTAIPPAPGMSAAPRRPVSNPVVIPPHVKGLMSFLILEPLLSLVDWLILFVAALLILQNQSLARLPAIASSLFKLALAVLAFSNFSRLGDYLNSDEGITIALEICFAFIGALLPAAMLIVMSLPHVRAYYRGLRLGQT